MPALGGHRSAEDDHRRLHGLPVVTRGVEGAIPGTRPGNAGHLERMNQRRSPMGAASGVRKEKGRPPKREAAL